MKENIAKEFLSQLSRFFKQGKRKESKNSESFLEKVHKEPMNASAHLKMAEIYQKHGEKKNARSEYLKAAEIFCDEGHYPKGLAVYKKVLREEPALESVNLKLADVYRNLGFTAQAFHQYQKLYCIYHDAGVQEKALEMIGFMAELEPQKFNLGGTRNSEVQGFDNVTANERNRKNKNVHLDPTAEGKKEGFFDLAAVLETAYPAEWVEPLSITKAMNAAN